MLCKPDPGHTDDNGQLSLVMQFYLVPGECQYTLVDVQILEEDMLGMIHSVKVVH